MMLPKHKVSFKLLAALIGSALGVVAAEFVLRIYNPLPVRIHGDRIKLVTNYHRKVVLKKDAAIPGLDSIIHYSTNSIGFRGAEPPPDGQCNFKIFTVGGSTTECSLLDDTKTWSFLLEKLLLKTCENVWLNNAGIDGCSTFGHQIILSEHLWQHKPDMVLFLVGGNDLFQALFPTEDAFLYSSREFRLRQVAIKSELFNFILSLYRLHKAKTMNITHSDKQDFPVMNELQLRQRQKMHSDNQKEYRLRLLALIDTCRKHGIIPVLITQPVHVTTSFDPLADIEIYNETTLCVAAETNVAAISLAAELASDGAFYYDNMHYANAGAQQVANILYRHLLRWIPGSRCK